MGAFLLGRDKVAGSDNPKLGGTEALPAAPTGLAVYTYSASALGLTWQDNANNEVGCKVYRSLSSPVGWTPTSILSQVNVDRHVDTGLAAKTKYYFLVRAYNGGGESAPSNEADGSTWLQEAGWLMAEAKAPIVPEEVPKYG